MSSFDVAQIGNTQYRATMEALKSKRVSDGSASEFLRADHVVSMFWKVLMAKQHKTWQYVPTKPRPLQVPTTLKAVVEMKVRRLKMWSMPVSGITGQDTHQIAPYRTWTLRWPVS